jgi:hypothetical protein
VADPADRADRATVVWDPEANFKVVLLATAPEGHGGLSFTPDKWVGNIARRDAGDGTHIIIITERGSRHQLQLIPPISDGVALAAIIPLDGSAQHRAEATLQFWQHAISTRRQVSRTRSRRLDRLVPTLRALDGHLAGASYRKIAEGMFGPSESAPDTWKTSSSRDRVIRLVRAGVALMKGGYRSLLKSRPRD